MLKNKKRSNTKKIVLITSVVIMLAATGAIATYVRKHPSPKAPANTDSEINLAPATGSDRDYSNSFKEQTPTPAPSQSNGDTSNNTVKTSVRPTIVDAGKYDGKVEARGYVSGIIEGGGVCTFSFSNGNTTINRQTNSAADATTTRCENLNTPADEFAGGTWTVTLIYTSSSAQGTSDSMTFEVR